MRPIKITSLAVLAALMAMAFVGSTSAMAEPTQLCKEDVSKIFFGEECPAGKEITHVHEVTLKGENSLLLTEALGTLECEVLFLGDTLELGNPLIIHGHFTWVAGTCFRGKERCTVTEVSTSAILEVLKEGHETSSVRYQYELKMVCGIFISCTYDGKELSGTGKGPLLAPTLENGHSVVSGKETHRVKGVCPEKGFLDLNLHPLEKTYIAK